MPKEEIALIVLFFLSIPLAALWLRLFIYSCHLMGVPERIAYLIDDVRDALTQDETPEELQEAWGRLDANDSRILNRPEDLD